MDDPGAASGRPQRQCCRADVPRGPRALAVRLQPAGCAPVGLLRVPRDAEEDPDVGPDNVAYTVRNLSTLFALNPDGVSGGVYVDPGILLEPVVSPSNSLVFMGGRITFGQPGFFWPSARTAFLGGVSIFRTSPASSLTGNSYRARTRVHARREDGLRCGRRRGRRQFAEQVLVPIRDRHLGERRWRWPGPGGAHEPRRVGDLFQPDRPDVDGQLGDRDRVRIERCTGNRCTNFVVVGNTDANVTAFTDTGLASRTSCRYRARSYNATGVSAPSNAVTIRTR